MHAPDPSKPLITHRSKVDGVEIQVWPYTYGQFRIKLVPVETEDRPYPSSLREM